MTDAERIALQERETLAVIESGSVRRNTPGIPKEEEAPAADVPVPAMGQETQASAKFRHELRASGMTAQEAENMVAEMEGRLPREIPGDLAGLAETVTVVVDEGLIRQSHPRPSAPPPEPVEMTDDEWLAARRRVTDAKARVLAGQAAVEAATDELQSALAELEAARRDVAAGAAWLTAP